MPFLSDPTTWKFQLNIKVQKKRKEKKGDFIRDDELHFHLNKTGICISSSGVKFGHAIQNFLDLWSISYYSHARAPGRTKGFVIIMRYWQCAVWPDRNIKRIR